MTRHIQKTIKYCRGSGSVQLEYQFLSFDSKEIFFIIGNKIEVFYTEQFY
jgi:hypothetical protein